jgi:cell division initiation protein
MLTPQEITGRQFVKAVFGGYDMTGVDDFLEAVTTDYSALYKENAILKNKIKVLVEKVEEYRSTEDSMRMALLTAQKEGERLLAEANRRSEEKLAETDREIRERLNELSNHIADEEARLRAARDETVRFVEASREIMARHGEFLSKLDEIRRPVETAPAEPTREDKIVDAAKQISDAVERTVSGESGEYDDEADPTRDYVKPSAAQDEGEPTSPRPKFDFEDLKFGKNFSE